MNNTQSIFLRLLKAGFLGILVLGNSIAWDSAAASFAFHSVPFTSQLEQSYLPNETCAVASLTMMLQYKGITPPDYTTLCKELKTTRQHGTSVADIFEYLDKRGVGHTSLNNIAQIKSQLSRGPVFAIVRMKTPVLSTLFGDFFSENHAIVIVGHTDTGFIYLDPYKTSTAHNRQKIMAFELFEKRWVYNVAFQLA